MNIKKWLSKRFFETALQKIKEDAMKKIKKWLSKRFFEIALAMLRLVVEDANPNLVFIGVMFGIFSMGFYCHFKCKQLKKFKRQKPKKKKKKKGK